jgi:branched-subunit amino acid ABC-type transport system permease component
MQLVQRLAWRNASDGIIAMLIGFGALVFNEPLTAFLFGLNANGLFLIAVIVAVAAGAALGGLMETTLIRPLYIRPIYQLMLTLGLSAIGIEPNLSVRCGGALNSQCPNPTCSAGQVMGVRQPH